MVVVILLLHAKKGFKKKKKRFCFYMKREGGLRNLEKNWIMVMGGSCFGFHFLLLIIYFAFFFPSLSPGIESTERKREMIGGQVRES